MSALENIKNSLIDRILATSNERLLEAIKNILTQHNQKRLFFFQQNKLKCYL